MAPAAVEPDAFVAEPIPVYAAAIGSGFAEQLAAERDEAAIGPGFAEELAAERDEAAAVVVAVERAWPVSSGSHFAPGEAQARALAGESRFHCHRCCGSRRDPSARRDCSNAPWASKSAAVLFFERALPELVEAELGRGEERGSAEEQEPAWPREQAE